MDAGKNMSREGCNRKSLTSPQQEKEMEGSVSAEKPTTEGTAKIIYILYLIGIIFGLTAIVGVVMAYVNRSDAPDWLQTHYQFQIRTFWLSLMYFIIGVLLYHILIGFFILLFWVIWLIVRCVKGMKFLDRKAPYPDPIGLLF